MLFLIATPIGNLGDFTFRALETLRLCDYLLCEDTRRSRILLHHYDVSKPLKSFHQWNEAKTTPRIIADLNAGKTIGLMSDAGTPCISDPGSRLVFQCRLAGISVIPLPGPCAAIAALSASGFPVSRFQFFGFLPRKKGKLEKTLKEILLYPGTTVCYESPFRIIPTLSLLSSLDPSCPAAIFRELTKKFEQALFGTAAELVRILTASPPKGEIVLLIRQQE